MTGVLAERAGNFVPSAIAATSWVFVYWSFVTFRRRHQWEHLQAFLPDMGNMSRSYQPYPAFADFDSLLLYYILCYSMSVRGTSHPHLPSPAEFPGGGGLAGVSRDAQIPSIDGRSLHPTRAA